MMARRFQSISSVGSRCLKIPPPVLRQTLGKYEWRGISCFPSVHSVSAQKMKKEKEKEGGLLVNSLLSVSSLSIGEDSLRVEWTGEDGLGRFHRTA